MSPTVKPHLFKPPVRGHNENEALEEGRKRTKKYKQDRLMLAIQDFCYKCSKGDCPGERWGTPCPLILRPGQGNPTSFSIKQICWSCMTHNNNTTGRCNSWYACPLYPHHVNKPQARAIQDIERKQRREPELPVLIDDEEEEP
jgi:hypothetical protein